MNEDRMFALEQAVRIVILGAQGACHNGLTSENIKALVHQVSTALRQAVTAQRSVGGNASDLEQALTDLGTALGALRVHVRMGSNVAEHIALARWLCDAVLGATRAGDGESPAAGD